MLKTAIRFFTLSVLLTGCLIAANAQDPKPAAPTRKPIPLSAEDRAKLELAQKDLEILELRKTLLQTQIQTTLTAALRTGGVLDVDFGKYTFNAETFTFTPKN